MNKLRKRWVEALRSGDYKQGHYELRTWDDKFCCLGVACEIDSRTAWKKEYDGGDWSVKDGRHFETSSLPQRLRTRFALTETQVDELVSMNDMKGMSFNAIADAIEQMPEVASV